MNPRQHFFVQLSERTAWPIAFVVVVLLVIVFLLLQKMSLPLSVPKQFLKTNNAILIWTEVIRAIPTLSAVIIALVVALKNYIDIKEEKMSGVGIENIDQNANVKLVNQSKIDRNIKVEKWIVVPHTSTKNKVEQFLNLTSETRREQIVNFPHWKSIDQYDLASKESILFHLYDVGEIEKVYITYVAIKLIINNKKTKYYLFRLAGGQASQLSQRVQNERIWIIEQSFVT